MSRNRDKTKQQLLDLQKASITAVRDPQERVHQAMAWAQLVVTQAESQVLLGRDFTSRRDMDMLATTIMGFAEKVATMAAEVFETTPYA